MKGCAARSVSRPASYVRGRFSKDVGVLTKRPAHVTRWPDLSPRATGSVQVSSRPFIDGKTVAVLKMRQLSSWVTGVAIEVACLQGERLDEIANLFTAQRYLLRKHLY